MMQTLLKLITPLLSSVTGGGKIQELFSIEDDFSTAEKYGQNFNAQTFFQKLKHNGQ
jgi:hypothetical protein